MINKLLTRNRRTQPARSREQAAVRPDASRLLLYAVFGAFVLVALPASTAALSLAATLNDAHPFVRQDAKILYIQDAGEVRRPVSVNVRPFKELVRRARETGEWRGIDLSRTIELVVEADRTTDGTLSNVTLTEVSGGGPELRNLAEDAIRALSESRVLTVLEDVSHVSLKFRLDADTLRFGLNADTPSAERASRMAHGYGAMLHIARLNNRNKSSAPLLNNMTLSANGKQLSMKLEMSRAEAGNLLLRQITPN